MQVLPDSSTIIALAKTGSLGLLKKTFGEVWITKDVEKEVTTGGFPEVGEIKKGMGKWIKVLETGEKGYKVFEGIGYGERSILSHAKGKKDVLLILDETEARAIAEEEGMPYTGTIGLIVFACETKRISKKEAVTMIRKLSRSDFRMTVELYDWALERLK
jgi:predicted nucleic acid-binding protein